MSEQGSSRLARDESGLILDRMAGLRKVISPELIRDVLQASGKHNNRCTLTHEVMMWVVLAMGLFTHLSIRQVFRQARRKRFDEPTPARSSLCMARQRLGSEPVKQLYRRVVRPLASARTVGGLYHGLRPVGLDGTVLDVPDHPNLQHYGRGSGSRGEGCFPQVRKLSLVELGTHIEFDFVFGGWCEHERHLAPRLWDSIPTDALLIEDRGLYSYDSWKTLHSRHKLLVRVQKSQSLKCIRRLDDGSFLSRIYKNSWDRQQDREGTEVRVIEYVIDDPRRTGHGEVHRLLTNLMDIETFPAVDLICMYHERWEHELVFDEQKTHQDPRRAEKTTNLRSQTVDGITQELYAISLGHFVIRALMLEAAEAAEVDVDRLSFTGCFRILQCRLPECDGRTRASFSQWYRRLMMEFREELIPPRRNRINPRVIKRKMSRWNKCRPGHRALPPLTKTFIQSVVMKL